MSNRLRKTVLLGDLIDPDMLFTTLPEPLRTRCRREFMRGRQETLDLLARAGYKPPASVEVLPEAFTGTMYDAEGKPTPEYAAWWKRYYGMNYVKNAQNQARKMLGRDDPTNAMNAR